MKLEKGRFVVVSLKSLLFLISLQVPPIILASDT